MSPGVNKQYVFDYPKRAGVLTGLEWFSVNKMNCQSKGMKAMCARKPRSRATSKCLHVNNTTATRIKFLETNGV